MSLCKLTICFEDPFWVGLVETEDREAHKIERKAESKQQRDERKEAAFRQKQAKRKQKHRGH